MALFYALGDAVRLQIRQCVAVSELVGPIQQQWILQPYQGPRLSLHSNSNSDFLLPGPFSRLILGPADLWPLLHELEPPKGMYGFAPLSFRNKVEGSVEVVNKGLVLCTILLPSQILGNGDEIFVDRSS